MNTRMRGGNAADGQLLATACSLAAKTFRRADIPAIRRFATLFGARAGMSAARLGDFMLAVSEAAACATSNGPCTARLRLWTTELHAMCEIRGDGVLFGQGPGAARRGDVEALRRWLLRQLCDHVSVDDDPQGVTVRFSMTVA
jgi:hypothetical protein